jgi:hypothetical protein
VGVSRPADNIRRSCGHQPCKTWSSISREGHLLHLERLPSVLLERRRVELGSYVVAAQYQQRLVPIGGGIVNGTGSILTRPFLCMSPVTGLSRVGIQH